jgi:hypothetical protein
MYSPTPPKTLSPPPPTPCIVCTGLLLEIASIIHGQGLSVVEAVIRGGSESPITPDMVSDPQVWSGFCLEVTHGFFPGVCVWGGRVGAFLLKSMSTVVQQLARLHAVFACSSKQQLGSELLGRVL